MRKIFREELRRALWTPRFFGAILIASAFLAFGALRIRDMGWIDPGYSFADLWFFAYQIGYFPFILPLVALMPFADSLAEDRSEGFINPIVFRGEYRRYLWGKFCANALTAALAIGIPLLLLYGYANLAAPRGAVPINGWEAPVVGRVHGLFEGLFASKPDIFILLVALTAMVSGALYAVFGMAISLITPNRYLVWAVPVALYLAVHFVATKTNLFGAIWSPISAVNGNFSIYPYPETASYLFLSPGALLCLTILIVLCFGRRERLLT